MTVLTTTRTSDLREIGTFAERLIGEPLWRHQLEVARSPARFRMILSGRRAGKTRLLAVAALHWAFTKAEQYVLVMSHGEDGAQDLLAEISALAGSEWLSASVEDDEKTLITLSNGSLIRCVPASQKRVRGKGADLLIIDEACFVEEELWNAAKFTVLANPGSRVILSSTPYGRRDKFFARYYAMGKGARGRDRLMYESFHAPSSVSPLVDKALLKEWKKTDPPRIYRREVEAEWVDEAGQYFTSAELDAVKVDYKLTPPAEAAGDLVVCGLDWGFASDASAMALLGVLDDGGLNADTVGDDAVWGFRWLQEESGMPYAQFVSRVVEAGSFTDRGAWERDRPGYSFRHVISEANGVGAMPTQELRRRFRTEVWEATGRRTPVYDVHTTARRKEAAFGAMKLLIGQGRLLLPHHTGLRSQLEALEFETLESGLTKISVPENMGHDDLAMAAAQTMACVRLKPMPREWLDRTPFGAESAGEVLQSGFGTRILSEPRSLYAPQMLRQPRGGDGDDEW